MTDHLIIGADSMIGAELIAYLQDKAKVVACTTRKKETISPSRLYFDLASLEGLTELPEAKVVYIVAAIARIEDCGNAPELSKKVNVDAVKAIKERLEQSGSFVIFLSSDKVFNGREPSVPAEHPTDPRTAYGRQKDEAELIIKKHPNSAVIRLTKVFGNEVSLFKNWTMKLKNNEEIHPFADMYMAPVSVRNVAECLSIIGEKHKPGLYQLSGNEDISYAEAALIGAEVLNLNVRLIKPIKTADSSVFNETPPRYASLAATADLPGMPVDSRLLVKSAFTKLK